MTTEEPFTPEPDDEGVVAEAEQLLADLDADLALDEVTVDTRTVAERQRDDYLDALQRLQAEFENYRKRTARASEEAAQRATGGLVARVLPTLDALDLAEAHFGATESAPDSLEAKALSQARSLLLSSLEVAGLARIDEAGVPFDPTVHDAVAHVDGEGGPVIDEVLRAGYRWQGSVLRPAMVKVRG